MILNEDTKLININSLYILCLEDKCKKYQQIIYDYRVGLMFNDTLYIYICYNYKDHTSSIIYMPKKVPYIFIYDIVTENLNCDIDSRTIKTLYILKQIKDIYTLYYYDYDLRVKASDRNIDIIKDRYEYDKFRNHVIDNNIYIPVEIIVLIGEYLDPEEMYAMKLSGTVNKEIKEMIEYKTKRQIINKDSLKIYDINNSLTKKHVTIFSGEQTIYIHQIKINLVEMLNYKDMFVYDFHKPCFSCYNSYLIFRNSINYINKSISYNTKKLNKISKYLKENDTMFRFFLKSKSQFKYIIIYIYDNVQYIPMVAYIGNNNKLNNIISHIYISKMFSKGDKGNYIINNYDNNVRSKKTKMIKYNDFLKYIKDRSNSL